jgi:hypothetical protein
VTVRREELEVHRVPLDGHEQPPVGGLPSRWSSCCPRRCRSYSSRPARTSA